MDLCDGGDCGQWHCIIWYGYDKGVVIHIYINYNIYNIEILIMV